MKKILYYNWTPLDSPDGGGVAVYQRNLINSLGGYDVTYLNSGYTYTFDKKLRLIEKTYPDYPDIKAFEVVNSPVLAPVQQSIKNIDIYLHDESLYKLIRNFIISQGGFDVIHFNNLEGLSLKVLSLKKDFPDTAFIYSVHNYFPVCSRVNLWKDEAQGKGHNCNKRDFAECAACYKSRSYKGEVTSKIANRYKDKDKAKWVALKITSKFYTLTENDSCDLDLYRQFEEKNIEYINLYFDRVLAVSQRVKTIMLEHGADKSKIEVSYIGTAVAEGQMGCCNAEVDLEEFNMIYMGYMRDDKGFYFLLDALKNVPPEIAAKISVTFAAKYDERTQRQDVAQIMELKRIYKNIKLVNGYTKQNQRELLTGIHLGIVPVLWEDNLPQVAIEQVAYGVPILVSDLGGAAEVCNNKQFVFKAGDRGDFLTKLQYIIENRECLNDFWKYSMHLVTMDQHINQLNRLYEGLCQGKLAKRAPEK
ncbi:glycosyltransferase family 4 protein [Oliverpabstia intestinalis]|uniref:glycosyltransferase family 4 protein n=1 Tax=Oliverpabstia intestinalis TaxID=2606633 RepID=UPI003F8CA9CD